MSRANLLPPPDDDDAEDGYAKLFPQEPCENPAKKGWTAALLVDVALRVDDQTLCDTYDLQYHELDEIKNDPSFIVQLAAVQKELEKEGVSFRLKAQMQAEALLQTSWSLIHSAATPAAVKAGLIKDTVRWAGFDAPPQAGAGGGRGGFSVNIVLNQGQPAIGLTIDQPSPALDTP